MSVKYGRFEMPEEIIVERDEAAGNFARFIAEPFERGFGHTLGNSLRRLMLTSLEAPAIIGVRIDGIPHEYMGIDGVVEDMTNIVLNIKGALLRKLPMEETPNARGQRILTKILEVTQEDLDSGNGQYVVGLGDIVENGTFEVVNPNHHIFTVTQPMKMQVDLRVAFGRGYVPSERHVVPNKTTDEILIDAAFTPVLFVKYHVENTRVGQDTDFDRLVLEVSTDGRVTPVEAFGFASQIGLKHFEIFKKVQSHTVIYDQEKEEGASDEDEIMEKLALRIDEIELSVRAGNCLSGANIETIAELVSIPERRMLEFRNFGKKSLTEIKAKLHKMGLSLGMDLSPYRITEENVREKIREYQAQHPKKDFTTIDEE